jgi:pimeloyl-ACP methyl ester carboxylesterase
MDLYVQTAGQGPAILWIHGYTMDSSVWSPLWRLLPGFRHVAVDLPGHGRSGPMPANLTLPDLGARLAEVAAAHEARQVVALSFGSSVALELVAVAAPAQVDRLVLAAPAIPGAPVAPGTARRERQLAALYRMRGPGRHLTRLWMSSPPDIFRGTERRPGLRAQLDGVIDRHGWTELATGTMRALAARVHTDEMLARITAATLVLTGAEDMPAFTANAFRLAALLPRCRSVTVAGAGHLCLLERPGPVAGLLRDHFA